MRLRRLSANHEWDSGAAPEEVAAPQDAPQIFEEQECCKTSPQIAVVRLSLRSSGPCLRSLLECRHLRSQKSGVHRKNTVSAAAPSGSTYPRSRVRVPR